MAARVAGSGVAVERLGVSAYVLPTDFPESDGTYQWDRTTLVVVEARGGGRTGLGYTYADTATARLIADKLAALVQGRDALAPTASYDAMAREVRNLGRPGIASMAISAVDTALWDLKSRLLELPLCDLLGLVRDEVPVYGSGGFTSYPVERLTAQLGGWVGEGIPRVKMKVGREPARDAERVRAARGAIGERAELFVDANGAYSRKQALALGERFAAQGVTWFEEPVSSDDLEGLRLVRDRVPPGIEVTAGEYGYTESYFRRMLESGAVDVLQADASRCGGVTGFLAAAALCRAFGIPLSAHCAPSLHVHVGAAATPLRHIEYFHDHVRIEGLLLDGAPVPIDGALRPDRTRSGMGLELKRKDAERYAA